MMKKEMWIMSILRMETHTGKKEIRLCGPTLQKFTRMTAKRFFDLYIIELLKNI